MVNPSHVTARIHRGGVAAIAAALLLAVAAGPTAANHDLYRRISVGVGSRGNAALQANFSAASDDGKRVFFTSSERLVLADTDSVADIYESSGGTTKRVSAGVINGNGTFQPSLAAVSTDGSRVFFTTSEQLVSGDTDGVQDVYERSAGTTILVSAGQINGNANTAATFQGSSSDGARVIFSTSEKLVAADTDSQGDVYARGGGITNLISTGQINGNLPMSAAFAGMSAGGARVWFQTQEKLVAGDTDDQVDVYERSTGQTFQISIGVINGNGAFASAFVGASSDGSRVFYRTTEQLVAADTDSAFDIYQFSAGAVTLISAGAINGNGSNNAFFSATSADGSRVIFTTNERLVTGDTDTVADIYQRLGGVTSRVSAGAINGNGSDIPVFRAASADGSRVFFDTFEKLVSEDTDASLDEYEFSAGATKLVSAGTINGNGAFGTIFGGISADGTRIFFRTGEQLTGDDDDTTLDVYERAAGQTDLVTIGAGNFDASFKRCSIDGLAVFLETTEKILASDKDTVTDVYGAYDAF